MPHNSPDRSNIYDEEIINPVFTRKKIAILQLLSASEEQYHDESPKGSVDEEICDLIHDINSLTGCVTTSSCAGRVAVFLEGDSTLQTVQEHVVNGEDLRQTHELPIRARKGPGGRWLYTSHSRIRAIDDCYDDGSSHMADLFQLKPLSSSLQLPLRTDVRFVHFKFEPMILHVLTSSPEVAEKVLKAALAAGFRESGTISATSVCPMVAVRCQGLALDSIIGFLNTGEAPADMEQASNAFLADAIVSEGYLRTLVNIANQRFMENSVRTEKFSKILKANFDTAQQLSMCESRQERWQRKRAEGLAKKARLVQGNDDAEVTLRQDYLISSDECRST